MSNVIIPQPVNTEQAILTERPYRALSDADVSARIHAALDQLGVNLTTMFARPDEQQTDPDADRERVSDGARSCREDAAAGVA